MDQNKQEKKLMQKKIQALYRETKRQDKEKKTDNINLNLNTFWKIIVSISVITFCVFLLMAALFDLGVEVPEIFGR